MKDALLHYSSGDLSVEYARLFVGPYNLAAPPYGSVYLDGGRKVMGDSTMEVMRLYQREGLTIDNEFKELPDHISVELEFMYYLAYKKVKVLEAPESRDIQRLTETQGLFLNKFLKPWVPLFCDEIRKGTDNEFYRALADCLLTFVESSQVSKNLTDVRERRNVVV
jgi:TorA maturation chaperone TorD